MKSNFELESQIHSTKKEFINKVEAAKRMIQEVYSDKLYVSWSGGKDSTVVLHLVHSLYKDVKICYIKSGYSFQDSYEYMIGLVQNWNLNYVEIPTPIDYIQLCNNYGLPHQRAKNVQKYIVGKIKKNPATVWAQKNGFEGLFWGIRAEESIDRKHLAFYRGVKFKDKNGIMKVSPILYWSVKDIFAYFQCMGVPLNPIYLKENCGMTRYTIRNTGWLSTDGESRGYIEWMRRNYPIEYQKVREFL